MNTSLKLGILTLAISGASCFIPDGQNPAQAAVFYESDKGDAGSQLWSAMKVNTLSGDTPLHGIAGILGNQVDLYQIFIDNTREFVATTEHRNNPLDLNTQLFLFDENGYGLYANDDTSPSDRIRYNPSSTRSTIRADAGELAYSGIYYLGISSYGLDPVWARNKYIFPDTRRALFGPDDAVNSPLTGWQGPATNSVLPMRAYTIALQGTYFVPARSPIPNQPPITPPSPTPSPAPSSTPSPISSPTPAPDPSVTPSPTPAPAPTPTTTTTPTPTPSASPTPAPSVAPSSTPSPTPTVTSSPSPTPDPTHPVSVPEPSAVFGLLALVLGGCLSRQGQLKGDR